jgi:hydroxymethylglutaryl-CoA lyase
MYTIFCYVYVPPRTLDAWVLRMTVALGVAQVEVVEVGPRDGLQNEATQLPVSAKVEFIQRAIAAGLRRIEATAFVHPTRVPQMADAEELMAAVPRGGGVSYIGLVLNRRGFERAVDAGIDEVNVVIVATDTFSQRNQGTTTEAGIAVWTEIASLAHRADIRPTVTISAAFGCPFEGEVSPDRIRDIARLAIDAGPAEITLADTIGVAVPTQVSELIGSVGDISAGTPLRCHLHNTRNTGYANAVAAFQAGVTALDASIGGIGGCPFAPHSTGNIATEDLVYLLNRMGVKTGLRLDALIETGKWIGEQLGTQVPSLVGRAGPFPPTAEPH